MKIAKRPAPGRVVAAFLAVATGVDSAEATNFPIDRSYGDKAGCEILAKDANGLGWIADKAFLLTPRAFFADGLLCVIDDEGIPSTFRKGAYSLDVTCYRYAPNAHQTFGGSMSLSRRSDRSSVTISELLNMNLANSKTGVAGDVALSKKTLQACKAPARK